MKEEMVPRETLYMLKKHNHPKIGRDNPKIFRGSAQVVRVPVPVIGTQ